MGSWGRGRRLLQQSRPGLLMLVRVWAYLAVMRSSSSAA